MGNFLEHTPNIKNCYTFVEDVVNPLKNFDVH